MKVTRFLSLALVCIMLMSCVAFAEGTDDPYGKYDAPVTLHVLKSGGKDTMAFDANDPDRISYYENAWINAYKDYLNIDVKLELAEDNTALSARVNTGMASNDLPDVMIVPKELLYVMAENDVLADLTEVWEKCENKRLSQEAIDGMPGVLANSTFDGKLLGIPMMTNGYTGTHMMWIRQDWLNKVNKQVPTTIDELIDVAQAFLKAGLGGDNTYAIAFSVADCFEEITAAYGAGFGGPYENNYWQKTEDGYVFNPVRVKEVSAALLKMQEMYKLGLFTPDLAVAVGKTQKEDVANSRVGIFFGPGWEGAVTISNSNMNDPEADWVVAALPYADDPNFQITTNFVCNDYIVVNKNCEHPEAFLKMLELELHSYYEPTEEESKELYVCEDGFAMWNLRYFRNFTFPTQDLLRTQLIKEGVASGAEHVASFADTNYQRVRKGLNGERSEEGYALTFTEAYSILTDWHENNRLLVSYDGPLTENMQLYSGNLLEALTAAMYKVVMGEDISVYEKAVDTWYAAGGQTITDEVNAYYASIGK